jgi:adenosyl cobinamide kinase/adenosyl cobinamide phosphate guanylyltransferase
MRQLAIPGSRLPGDEVMRQHARAMRKAMKGTSMNEEFQKRIAEHEATIAAHKETAKETHAQLELLNKTAEPLQQKLQTLMTDIVRRQGSIMQLRLLMGLSPDEVAASMQSEPEQGEPQ